MESFSNKNAYITGGSSGIGLAVACELAARGANVILFARRMETLDQAVSQVSSKKKNESQRVDRRSLDVADPAAISRVMAEAVRDFGPPDLVVNCAGRAVPHPFSEVTADQFEATMRINLAGAWHVTAALTPLLKPGAHLVNVSSVAGLIGVFGYTDYCASKFALVGFSEALRSELKPKGIAVSVLCPPDTDTPGFVEENKTKPEETKAVSGNVRPMSAERVAAGLIQGLQKNRFLIIPGLDGRFSVLVNRLFPGLVRWIMDRQVRGVARRSA